MQQHSQSNYFLYN